jgi:hypothetical protein
MALEGNPGGRRRKGRSRKRWLDDVQDDMIKMGVQRWRTKAMGRAGWRKICFDWDETNGEHHYSVLRLAVAVKLHMCQEMREKIAQQRGVALQKAGRNTLHIRAAPSAVSCAEFYGHMCLRLAFAVANFLHFRYFTDFLNSGNTIVFFRELIKYSLRIKNS